jgi:hypothetical protein
MEGKQAWFVRNRLISYGDCVVQWIEARRIGKSMRIAIST